MREQVGYPYRQPQPVIQRKSLAPGQGNYVQSRTANPHLITDDEVETRLPTHITPRSAVRWQPTTKSQAIPRKRVHWFTWVGVALFVMIIGWIAFTAVSQWWQGVLDNFNYGMPRTYQTDQNVGHYGRVSHFIVINYQGEIDVIETQKGHPEASKIYTVTVLPEDQAYLPATISFQDINGDKKIDALVHVGATEIPMYNNGGAFQSQPPGH